MWNAVCYYGILCTVWFTKAYPGLFVFFQRTTRNKSFLGEINSALNKDYINYVDVIL